MAAEVKAWAASYQRKIDRADDGLLQYVNTLREARAMEAKYPDLKLFEATARQVEYRVGRVDDQGVERTPAQMAILYTKVTGHKLEAYLRSLGVELAGGAARRNRRSCCRCRKY